MILALVGPTASGKSALALELARRLRQEGRSAEIISADSMLVYRGMDIGTAKPTPAERAEVPHHLVDILDVTQTATVAEFQAAAREAIDDVLGREALPILVGGSALYVRAVLDHFDFPGTDPAVRDELERQAELIGALAMHQRLAELDPAAAGSIQPNNLRRVIRALEVIALTGKPYAATLPPPSYALPDVVQIGLDVPRPLLDERIGQRVDSMFATGLVEEVRVLLAGGLREGQTASRGLGYRQVIALLDGEVSAEEARRLTAQATRKFARRQDSWFRRDDRIRWLAFDRPDLTEAALATADLSGAAVED